MRINKAGLVWIVLISFLSVLRLTFSLPVLVYKTEDVLTLQRRSALHFVETDEELFSIQRRGLVGTGPNKSGSTFKNGVGAIGRAMSRAGQAIKTQISRVGTYARAAANPTHTGTNFVNNAAKKGAFGKKMK